MKKIINEMKLRLPARSENEGAARSAISAFAAILNPTVEELADIKTAISEAATNAILHGYDQDGKGMVHMYCERNEKELLFRITDEGVGIENVSQAMEPLYTSKPEQERSGMGFSFMEAFMDTLSVESVPGKGTVVTMTKRICPEEACPSKDED